MSARFDIMLATAMRLSGEDAGARAASWRQIVDIVAQAGSRLDVGKRAAAFERLGALCDHVPPADRRMAAGSLAGRTADPLLAVMFARDLPAIAAPFLVRVELSPEDWRQAIPAMPAAARNILRNRRDLPEQAVAMLGSFASADLTLPPYAGPEAVSADNAPVDALAPGVTQIRELVDRIEAYRQRVPLPHAADPRALQDEDAPEAEGFTFETMADGTIDWIEGAPREAIVGMSIAEPASFGVAGVDGQAAGAWRRRAPFHDARLLVAGLGGAGGDWLISAAPLFNPEDGRFCGYRGLARRPRADERAGGPSSVGGIAPDSLRQLVHELRTPLNAIQGFAEMIDKQILGPAATRYRDRARAIMVEAQRLVAMVDDLDTSARLDSGRLPPEPADDADMAAIAVRICAQHRATLASRDVALVLDAPTFAVPIAAATTTVERMMSRLLAAVSAVAAPGETVSAIVGTQTGSTAFLLTRPLALAARDEPALLDPGYGPDGDWPDAPLLGLGFTLRLVARLATQAGGSLTILPDSFALHLPAPETRAEVQPA
jgi:hypothetical protein